MPPQKPLTQHWGNTGVNRVYMTPVVFLSKYGIQICFIFPGSRFFFWCSWKQMKFMRISLSHNSNFPAQENCVGTTLFMPTMLYSPAICKIVRGSHCVCIHGCASSHRFVTLGAEQRNSNVLNPACCKEVQHSDLFSSTMSHQIQESTFGLLLT